MIKIVHAVNACEYDCDMIVICLILQTTKNGRDHQTNVMKMCSQVMMLIQDMPVPVIAQVQGQLGSRLNFCVYCLSVWAGIETI